MWDKRYSEPGYAYGTEPNDFLVSTTHHIPRGGRVLCLAEGEGRNSVYLAKQGFHVVAVDSSSVGLEKARELAERHLVTIETEVADLVSYQIPEGSFDAVISIFCHLNPGLQRSVHQKACSGLTKGGVFILEGYSKKQLERNTGGPKNEDLLMDLTSVKDELKVLDLIIAREVERDVREGRYHAGVGALIQVVGRKP